MDSARGECARWREACSARLDGEPLGVDEQLLDAHLGACADCRGFIAEAGRLHRATRLAPAEPVPDLTGAILEQAAHRRGGIRRWTDLGMVLRWVLVVIAAVEMGLAAPGFLGRWHTGGELGTWGIAAAIGFLSVAAKPSRAPAVLPMLAAAAGLTMVVSARHIADGAAIFTGELPHLVLLVGVVVLAMLWRHEARGGEPGPQHAADIDTTTGRVRTRRAA